MSLKIKLVNFDVDLSVQALGRCAIAVYPSARYGWNVQHVPQENTYRFLAALEAYDTAEVLRDAYEKGDVSLVYIRFIDWERLKGIFQQYQLLNQVD